MRYTIDGSESGAHVWFTSDTHFGHANILAYARRPFASVDAMDEALIEKWNRCVGTDDLVYHLGDFFFTSRRARTDAILDRLHGRIHLIRGNHDRAIDRHKARFVWIKDLAEIKVQDNDFPASGVQRIVLCHYAMRVWKHSHHGAWQLYGHSHGNLPEDPHARSCDVGVDCWNYIPVGYHTLQCRLNFKQYVPVDHHGR